MASSCAATPEIAACAAAIGTLLIQGLTLPWMIRTLGLGSEEDEARVAYQQAGLRLLTTQAAAAELQPGSATWRRSRCRPPGSTASESIRGP